MSDGLKRAFLSGLLVVLPLGVLLLVLAKVTEVMMALTRPLAEWLGLHSILFSLLALAVAALLLAALTALIGFAAAAGLTGGAVKALETSVLRRVPGYDVLNRLIGGLRDKGEIGYRPALAAIYRDGAQVFCLVMETLPDGRMVVFAPSSPAMTVGSVHILKPELVEKLEAGALEIAGVAAGWGVGAERALAPRDAPAEG